MQSTTALSGTRPGDAWFRAGDPYGRTVAGWPSRFEPKRALALGFTVEASFDDIIRAYIEDELGGRVAT